MSKIRVLRVDNNNPHGDQFSKVFNQYPEIFGIFDSHTEKWITLLL